jgi:hypothetical protein
VVEIDRQVTEGLGKTNMGSEDIFEDMRRESQKIAERYKHFLNYKADEARIRYEEEQDKEYLKRKTSSTASDHSASASLRTEKDRRSTRHKEKTSHSGQTKESLFGKHEKIEKERLGLKIDKRWLLGGGVALGGVGLGYLAFKSLTSGFSGSDDNYNTIKGMHPGDGGYATSNIRSMTHFGSGSIFGLRGFSAVSGLTGAFLKSEEIATKLLPILNWMPTKKELLSLQFRTGLRRSGLNSKTTKKAILNYYNDTLKIKKAISNHSGINGMIVVDPLNPELRYAIRHERQHFYNDISSKQSGSYGLSLEDVDPTFQKEMRGNDHYSKQINAQGEETIIDEWIAYTAAKHPLHRLMFSEELQFSAIRAGKQNKAMAKQFLKEQRIEGLHPGNQGYATQIIRSQTDFGSKYQGLKNTINKALELVGGAIAKANKAGGFYVGGSGTILGRPLIHIEGRNLISKRHIISHEMQHFYNEIGRDYFHRNNIAAPGAFVKYATGASALYKAQNKMLSGRMADEWIAWARGSERSSATLRALTNSGISVEQIEEARTHAFNIRNEARGKLGLRVSSVRHTGYQRKSIPLNLTISETEMSMEDFMNGGNSLNSALHPGDGPVATSVIRGMTPFDGKYNWKRGLSKAVSFEKYLDEYLENIGIKRSKEIIESKLVEHYAARDVTARINYGKISRAAPDRYGLSNIRSSVPGITGKLGDKLLYPSYIQIVKSNILKDGRMVGGGLVPKIFDALEYASLKSGKFQGMAFEAETWDVGKIWARPEYKMDRAVLWDTGKTSRTKIVSPNDFRTDNFKLDPRTAEDGNEVINFWVRDFAKLKSPKIEGLHPGNRGYATQIIRSQTDFGSKYQGLKNTIREAFNIVSGKTGTAVMRVETPNIIMLNKLMDNPEAVRAMKAAGLTRGQAAIKMTPAGVHGNSVWVGLEHDIIKEHMAYESELAPLAGALSDKTGFITKERININGQIGHGFIKKGSDAERLMGFGDSPEWHTALTTPESEVYHHSQTEFGLMNSMLEAMHAVPPSPMTVSKSLRARPTTGLVNHVLEPNGRNHHIAQNKAY